MLWWQSTSLATVRISPKRLRIGCRFPPAESDGQQTRLIRVAVAYGLTHPGGAIERILRGCGILDDPAILSGVGEISTYDFSDYDRFAEYQAITTSMNTLQKKMSILRMVTSTRRIIDEASGAALRRDSFIHFWKGGKDTDLEIRKHVQETAENVGIPVE
jgi:hypothetical protein